MARSKVLPKTLYVVRREGGTENEYLYASEDFTDFDHEEIVGTYTLTSTDVLETTKKLKPKSK